MDYLNKNELLKQGENLLKGKSFDPKNIIDTQKLKQAFADELKEQVNNINDPLLRELAQDQLGDLLGDMNSEEISMGIGQGVYLLYEAIEKIEDGSEEQVVKTFQFPVTPPGYKVGGEQTYNYVQIVNLGELSLPGGDKLDSVSFASFFPRDYQADYCSYVDIPDPKEAVKLLNDIRRQHKPVRLIITDSPVNLLVNIISFNYEERGGEPGDLYFDISFKAFRNVEIRTIKNLKDSLQKKNTRPNNKTGGGGTKTVKSGDTLWKIAKKELGDGSRWKEIYELNKKTIGKDPNQLKPGQKLVMPK